MSIKKIFWMDLIIGFVSGILANASLLLFLLLWILSIIACLFNWSECGKLLKGLTVDSKGKSNSFALPLHTGIGILGIFLGIIVWGIFFDYQMLVQMMEKF